VPNSIYVAYWSDNLYNEKNKCALSIIKLTADAKQKIPRFTSKTAS